MLRSPQVSREPVQTSPALPRTVEGLTAMLNQYGHDKKELTQQLIEAKAEISRLSHEVSGSVISCGYGKVLELASSMD